MSMETFRCLEPWFPSADLVFLQGWGEPLLHPKLWEMARRVRATGARVGLTTGGALLDQGNRTALLDSGVDIMGVSLAGASPQIHDHFRPGNALDTVDANLQALRKERKASGGEGPGLHLAYLLMTGNLHDLPRAVDLAEGWGADQIVVSHLSLVLSPGLEEEALLAHPDRWPQVQATLDETRERAEARGIGFHTYGPQGGERPEPACTENVLASCFVSVRGDVSPCVMTNLGLGTGEEPGAGQGPDSRVVIVPHPGLEAQGEAGDAQGLDGVEGSQVGPAPGCRGASAPTHWFRGSRTPLSSLIFGNVREASLKEIWYSSSARRFREVFRERLEGGVRNTEGLPGPCIHCYKLFQR
jgi:MoaA/NifB/PqqE/SkfB family radical SAM enzyme